MTRVRNAATRVAAVITISFLVGFRVTPAAAQTTDSVPPRSALRASVGISSQTRYDATASPVSFAGTGVNAATAYERSMHGWSIAAGVDASTHHLAPAAPTLDSRERLTEGALELSALRPTIVAPHHTLLVGVTGDVAVSLTEHGYTDPSATVESFLLGTATLGPAAEWRQSLGRGRLTVRATVPVVGWIEHPYGDLKVQAPALHLRLISPSALRGGDISLSFETNPFGSFGLMYAYDAQLLRIADVQPVRGAAQWLSVGIVRRFR